MMRLPGMIAAVLACAVAAGCAAPPKPPAAAAEPARPAPAAEAAGELPFYTPATGVSGKIRVFGMATTMNLLARSAATFKQLYPEASLATTSGPAKTGLAALAEGRADIVPMTRPLTPEEIRDFTLKAGHPPTEIKVAADALAIYVEKKNPIAGLTLAQLDGIFSRTQRRGGGSIETWGQAGLTGEWADRPIVLFGYGRGDGVHQFFREQVLEGGDFRVSMRVEGGGSTISQGVASEPTAIGCASILFACKRVRAVPIAGADGRFYAPTPENVRSRKYPLSRYLYVCVNKPPRQPLGGPAAEFLRFLLSREGQRIVADGGNVALEPAVAAEGRRALAE
jgi:phosphate transport system substrate-binding protein